MNTVMWWGYLHENGSIQVKRWFGDHEDYKGDCIGNPFVKQVVPPFEAGSRSEALEILCTSLAAKMNPKEQHEEK